MQREKAKSERGASSAREAKRQADASDHDEDPPAGGLEDKEAPEPAVTAHRQGKLILDATVAEQAIRYPTDLSLLNEAREFSERIIDLLYP